MSENFLDPPVKASRRGASIMLAPGINMRKLSELTGIPHEAISGYLAGDYRPKDYGVYDMICITLGWTKEELRGYIHKRWSANHEKKLAQRKARKDREARKRYGAQRGDPRYQIDKKGRGQLIPELRPGYKPDEE